MKKVTLNKSEYRAINALRGAPERVHLMIMCANATDTGGELDGSEADFEALVSFIGEELGEGMLSATHARTLARLCVKIDPGCAEWLGL